MVTTGRGKAVCLRGSRRRVVPETVYGDVGVIIITTVIVSLPTNPKL